ncbi:MAG TPA: hypothetical protein VIP70_07310 [Nitrososphaeraceae archaeon]|jgi:hypothetical protein
MGVASSSKPPSSTAATTSKPKLHRCNVCGRTFDNVDILNSHLKLEHSESSHPPAGVS